MWGRKFLGYSFWVAAQGEVRRRVAPKALEGMKHRVRQITRRTGGRSMEQVTSELGAYLRGWRAYFKLADTPAIFRDLDGWIHRRLRALHSNSGSTDGPPTGNCMLGVSPESVKDSETLFGIN